MILDYIIIISASKIAYAWSAFASWLMYKPIVIIVELYNYRASYRLCSNVGACGKTINQLKYYSPFEGGRLYYNNYMQQNLILSITIIIAISRIFFS